MRISSDRYCSYNKLTRQTQGLTNAFCWVHFRRDFINAGKGYTFLKAWSEIWVSRIGELYHLNKKRLTALEVKKNASTEQDVLATALETFAQQIDVELASPTLTGFSVKFYGVHVEIGKGITSSFIIHTYRWITIQHYPQKYIILRIYRKPLLSREFLPKS